MSEPTSSDARTEALQNVIDRVVSYEESATPETIRTQLREGLSDAGIDLDDSTVERLVRQIDENPEDVKAADFL